MTLPRALFARCILKTTLFCAIGAWNGLTLGADFFRADAFSPEKWPGKASSEFDHAIKPIADEYLRVMRSGDREALLGVRDRLVAALGPYAGVPEERPAYGQPINTDPPVRHRIEKLWTKSLDRLKNNFGWDQATKLQAEAGAGGKVPRLRVSQRQIQALLDTHEAGLDPSGQCLRHAIAGLDYLLAAQASTGVFGYPYEPGGPGLRRQAVAAVERGERQGRTMVERNWVIDDLDTGGLNFDNGVCGVVLLRGYVLTSNQRYLVAARRAGEWARKRPLVLNYNYNGFSGILLARLYRVTGEKAWLDEAKRVFEFGVLPGQMPDGRWFDQHNAKVQYHAILCSQLLEYQLALKQAGDVNAAEIARRLQLSLDNLAVELTTYGTNNAFEALSIAALSGGSIAFGTNATWERGANVAVNYVAGPLQEELSQRGLPLPEPVAAWLLLQSCQDRSFVPAEFHAHRFAN